jgi:hypothetical protein
MEQPQRQQHAKSQLDADVRCVVVAALTSQVHTRVHGWGHQPQLLNHLHCPALPCPPSQAAFELHDVAATATVHAWKHSSVCTRAATAVPKNAPPAPTPHLCSRKLRNASSLTRPAWGSANRQNAAPSGPGSGLCATHHACVEAMPFNESDEFSTCGAHPRVRLHAPGRKLHALRHATCLQHADAAGEPGLDGCTQPLEPSYQRRVVQSCQGHSTCLSRGRTTEHLRRCFRQRHSSSHPHFWHHLSAAAGSHCQSVKLLVDADWVPHSVSERM